MSFFSNEPTKELDQDDYEDDDYEQEDGRQNYLQDEEVYYNSDDPSENEYEMSQNTPILSPEGSQSRHYDDEYAAVGDVENCSDKNAAEYRNYDEQEADIVDHGANLDGGSIDPISNSSPHLEQTDPDLEDNDSGDDNRESEPSQPAETPSLGSIALITTDIVQNGVADIAVTQNKFQDGLTEHDKSHPKASLPDGGNHVRPDKQIEISALETAAIHELALAIGQPTTIKKLAANVQNDSLVDRESSNKQPPPSIHSPFEISPINQNALLNRASMPPAAKPPIAEARLGHRTRLIMGIADVNRPSLKNRAETTSQGLRRRFEVASGSYATQNVRSDGDTNSTERNNALNRSAPSAGSTPSATHRGMSFPGPSAPPQNLLSSTVTGSPAIPNSTTDTMRDGDQSRTMSASREVGSRPRDQDVNIFQNRTLTEAMTMTNADGSRTSQSTLLSPQRLSRDLSGKNVSFPSIDSRLRTDITHSDNVLTTRNTSKSIQNDVDEGQFRSDVTRLDDTGSSITFDRDREQAAKFPRSSSSPSSRDTPQSVSSMQDGYRVDGIRSFPSRALQMRSREVERPRVDVTDIEAKIGDIISGTTKRLREIQQDCGNGSFVLARDELPDKDDSRSLTQVGERGKRPRERDCNVPAFVAALEQDSFTLAKALCRLMENDALLLAPRLFKNETDLNLLRQKIEGIK